MDIERLYDVDLERAVLSACLMSPQALRTTMEQADQESFSPGPHRNLWEVLVDMTAAGAFVDQLTVGARLREIGWEGQTGGAVYLAKLTGDYFASPHNIQHYLRLLIDKQAAREAVTTMADAAKSLTSGGDVGLVVEEAQRKLQEALLTQKSLDDSVGMAEACTEVMEALRKAAANPGKLTGITTGFVRLDEMTGGWQDTDLVTLAGRTSHGKTALSLDFILAAAMSGVNCLFFSCEQKRLQIMQRLVSKISGVNLQSMRTGRLTPTDFERMAQATTVLSPLPIWIDDTTGLSPQAIVSRTRRRMKANGVKVAFVDYLQRLAWPFKEGSREQEVARITKTLKDGALDLGLPMVALAQLGRDIDRQQRQPVLADLRESGNIEQESDLVLFIYRAEAAGLKEITMRDGSTADATNRGQFILAKHRNGPTGDMLVDWDPTIVSFRNAAHVEVPPPVTAADMPWDLPVQHSKPAETSELPFMETEEVV